MYRIRPAVPDDTKPVADMIRARAEWMKRRGLRGADGWYERSEVIASTPNTPENQRWVLVDAADTVLGCTSLASECPPFLWTDDERAEPSVFLHTTVTDPAYAGQRLGCRIVTWALGHAAEHGAVWVRRGTGPDPGLIAYYRDAQGFEVVRSVERHGVAAWGLQRRTAHQPVAV